MKIGSVAKAIVAGVLAAAQGLNIAMGDDTLTTSEMITSVLAVLTVLGVYVVPNGKDDTPAE